MTKFYKIIFLAFALSACTVPQNPLTDLDFMHDQIVENHPGMYNSSDPLFKDELEKAYLKACNEIASSSDSDQQKLALTLFAKSFNDAHVWVSWKNTSKNDILHNHRTYHASPGGVSSVAI